MLNLSFNVTFPVLWSLCYFWTVFYVFGLTVVVLYLLSNIKTFFSLTTTQSSDTFTYLSGYDLYWFLVTPVMAFLLINTSWSGPSVLVWFGHLIFTSFQYKMTYLTIFLFLLLWSTYVTSFSFASKEVYDFVSVTYSLFVWLTFLFTVNNLFTTLFFIELLSTLIMLLIITSTFSTTFNYTTIDLAKYNYFGNNTPFTYLHSIIFFFWISLLGSLSLFFFSILFFTQFITFDWFLCEFVLHYVLVDGNFSELLRTLVTWATFLFCIFLKCGLPPFFFWKPLFFKGLPLHTLTFYVFYFYFFVYIFFIYFFIVYTTDLFFYLINLHVFLLTTGLLFIIGTLLESYYIKTFIAMSSILNSMFVFFALLGVSVVDVYPSF